MSRRSLRILVVDDDEDNVHSLAELFELEGHQAHVVNSGEAAIAAFETMDFDVAFMDVMMPGKNGWEVARELRGDPSMGDIGIVMLTAIGEKVNEMTSPLYGADGYVDKPFDFGELETKISHIIQKRKKAKGG